MKRATKLHLKHSSSVSSNFRQRGGTEVPFNLANESRKISRDALINTFLHHRSQLHLSHVRLRICKPCPWVSWAVTFCQQRPFHKDRDVLFRVCVHPTDLQSIVRLPRDIIHKLKSPGRSHLRNAWTSAAAQLFKPTVPVAEDNAWQPDSVNEAAYLT